MTVKLSDQIPEEQRPGVRELVDGHLLGDVFIEWVPPVGARLVCGMTPGQIREADGTDSTAGLMTELEEILREHLADKALKF